MNEMKLLQLTVAFALVGVVFSSDLLDVTENDALHRYKRAWSNEKRKVANCKAGEKAVVKCEKCNVGYYTQEEGLWRACVKCPKGKTTLGDNRNKCVPTCSAGKTWNTKKKYSKNCKKSSKTCCKTSNNCCKTCPANTFKNDSGSHECTECPRFWKPNPQFTACNKFSCPAGYEERTLPDSTKTCTPCKFGYFKGSKMKICRQCPDGRWTLTNGATALKDCIAKISDPVCNAAFPSLVNVLEEYAHDMTFNDTLGDVLCYTSTDICELHDKIIACMDVLDTSTGKELLPVYNDYDKSVHLTSITTHMPWCITIRVPIYSSYLSSSSSGAWSHDDTLGWSRMFRESAGTGMENARMAGPSDAAGWNHEGSAATTSPTTEFSRSSSYWISGGALIVPGGPGLSACYQFRPNPPFARLSGSSSKRFPLI